MVNESKNEYLEKIRDRYEQAGRRYKKLILDEFCKVCGHHRKHAIRLLNRKPAKRRDARGAASAVRQTGAYGSGRDLADCHTSLLQTVEGHAENMAAVL